MTRTYWWQAPAGRLTIRCFKAGLWRLWAGEDFLGSFDSPEEAVSALAQGSVVWPPGAKPARWKAPPDLDDWVFESAR